MKAFSHPSKEKPTDIEAPLSHQTEVNDILKSLDDLLDSMRKNHSVISQMAESWGELSFWIKISVNRNSVRLCRIVYFDKLRPR